MSGKIQRILLDGQQEGGHWEEGGRIFDDGTDTLDDVFQRGSSTVACSAFSQTIKLPVGTKPLFTPDPKLAQAIDEMAATASKDYDGKAEKSMKKIEMPQDSADRGASEE